MSENLRRVWRLGSNWGGIPTIKIFKDKQIAFFGNDSNKIGNYSEAKKGDLLAINAPNTKIICAIARMDSKFSELSAWSKGYQKSLQQFWCEDNPQNTIICHATIVELNSSDYQESTDYKRFYDMGNDKIINSLWEKYYESSLSEYLNKQHFKVKELGSGLNLIKIPSVQRSLVWKPKQIELLWDSLFRGFPIGSFIVYPNDNGLELLDGQQRQNAIKLGYSDVFQDDIRLWLDLGFSNNNSTRKYWVRSITKAHPWGFNTDDECSVLDAEERRKALNEFGYVDEFCSISNTEIDLNKCWPWKNSVCPIPMNYLFEYSSLSENEFKNKCLEKCIKNLPDKIIKEKILQHDEIWSDLYKLVNNVKDIYIPFSILNKEIINNETSDLEILFRRITSGGTAITNAELNYSAIKVYWPEIRTICDRVESKCVPAHLIANIAFRLFLLEDSDTGKWASDISIHKIRQLSENKTTQKHVEDVFNKLEGLINRVNEWLTKEEYGMPKVLRSDLALQCPDLFLLLLWVANHHEKINDLTDNYILSLSFYIKCFSYNVPETVKYIYEKCHDDFSPNNILSALYDVQAQYNCLIWLHKPSELEDLLNKSISKFNESWRISNLENESIYQFWRFISQNPWDKPDFLIYAERKYFSDVFSRYDPSQRKIWDSHNRPWDYDHIIPKQWLYRMHNGNWLQFDKEWMNEIGNFAAIPFELNRSKNANPDWKYYKDKSDQLLFNADVEDIDNNLRFYEDQSKLFAKVTFDRTIAIYKSVYDLVRIIFGENVDPFENESFFVVKRKLLIKNLKNIFDSKNINHDVAIRYIDNNRQIKDLDLNIREDWANPYISLDISIDKDKIVSVSFTHNETIVGIAMPPNIDKLDDEVFNSIRLLNNNGDFNAEKLNRWYLCKYTRFDLNDLVNKLEELISKIS